MLFYYNILENSHKSIVSKSNDLSENDLEKLLILLPIGETEEEEN